MGVLLPDSVIGVAVPDRELERDPDVGKGQRSGSSAAWAVEHRTCFVSEGIHLAKAVATKFTNSSLVLL